ncbi:MAG: AbrB/MazE/SpoVT family DNA-binding domain-containing protein [Conexivisphaerales archaeon]
MEYEVVITRKGQTTIPAPLRKKYRMVEGTRLVVIDSGEGILLKPAASILDLAGSGAIFATAEEMKKELRRMREEDA